MHEVTNRSQHGVGHEIVFHGRVSLHDVATFPADVHIVNLSIFGDISRGAGFDLMCSFYEMALWSKIEKKHRKNSHLIIHFPTKSGGSE